MDELTLAMEALLSHVQSDMERRILLYWALHQQLAEGFCADTDLSLKFRETRWKGEIGTRLRWLVNRVTEDNGIDRPTLAKKLVEVLSQPA